MLSTPSMRQAVRSRLHARSAYSKTQLICSFVVLLTMQVISKSSSAVTTVINNSRYRTIKNSADFANRATKPPVPNCQCSSIVMLTVTCPVTSQTHRRSNHLSLSLIWSEMSKCSTTTLTWLMILQLFRNGQVFQLLSKNPRTLPSMKTKEINMLKPRWPMLRSSTLFATPFTPQMRFSPNSAHL